MCDSDMAMKGMALSVVLPVLGASFAAFKFRGLSKDPDALLDSTGDRPDRKKLIKGWMMLVVFLVSPVLYGLLVAVIGMGQITDINCNATFAGGAIMGLTGCAVNLGMAFYGDRAMRALAKQPRVFVGKLLILIFMNSIALYAFIASLVILSGRQRQGRFGPTIVRTADMSFSYMVNLVSGNALANFGAIFATTTIGGAVMDLAANTPQLLMRAIIFIVLSGVLAIYGLIASIIPYGATAVMGALCLISGLALGTLIPNGIQAMSENPKSFVRTLVKAIACLALGQAGLMYGLVHASLNSKAGVDNGFGTFGTPRGPPSVQLIDQGVLPGDVSPVVFLPVGLLLGAIFIAVRCHHQPEDLGESLLH